MHAICILQYRFVEDPSLKFLCMPDKFTNSNQALELNGSNPNAERTGAGKAFSRFSNTDNLEAA